MLVYLWGFLYRHYFRFWLKWVLRLLTGKCELQRLFDNSKAGARRTLCVEHSLESSKNKVLRNAVHVEEAEVEKCVRDVMKEKKIEQKDTGFKTNLLVTLLQISGYKKLYLNVENLRKVPYDSDNEEHEEQLIELWNLLMPHENLKARITKQWCDIGFQGDDPKTDFRGMGLLGLVNLVYFSKHYTDEARQILSRSNHPKLGECRFSSGCLMSSAQAHRVGMFKIHPEIPESLCAETRAFILLCFEPDPTKRVTAADLLRDSFLKQVNKGKKNRIAFKPTDYNRTTSLPLPIHGEQAGSSSSEHGSVSPDSDVQHDMFFERSKRSDKEIQTKHPISHLISVPDDSSTSEDRSTSPSLEDKDSGLFLLRKDSERRAILYKILKEEQNEVASNLQDCIAQSSEELRLSVAHIKQIIGILRDFIRSPEQRVMASTISKLKMDLDFDSTSINQIHLVLFGFQDAVNKVLRNHLIRPHWMFAMDNIIRRAVQAAVTILIPELRAHFEPASETEGGDKECDEAEVRFQPAEQNGAEDPVVTSGVSTLSSVVSHEAQQQLSLELARLKQETLRLLENLVQKEKEYQALLRQCVEQKTQELHLLQLQLKPKDSQWSAASFRENADPELTNWLKQQGADLDAIKRFAEEDYTLSSVLNDITKDDLRYLQLRGGLLCRIWKAILNHRQIAGMTSEQKVDALEGEGAMGINK